MPNQFQLTVQQWDIDKVIPYVNNTKKHPPEQIDKLASMIAEYGFDVPIVVDGDGVIIKGHGRLQAFKKLNALTVPVVVRNDLTPAQCKAARIADNKIAESEWDMDLLKIELEELTELDFDLDLTGFGDLDLDLGFNEEKNKSNVNGIEYSDKIKSPIYIPTGEKPEIHQLFNTSKADELIKDIDSSNLKTEEKQFLRFCAYRHIVFNYQNIAEFYAHASPELQCLMENSALVIIDFNKAIELGFVKLSKDLMFIANEDKEKENINE